MISMLGRTCVRGMPKSKGWLHGVGQQKLANEMLWRLKYA